MISAWWRTRWLFRGREGLTAFCAVTGTNRNIFGVIWTAVFVVILCVRSNFGNYQRLPLIYQVPWIYLKGLDLNIIVSFIEVLGYNDIYDLPVIEIVIPCGDSLTFVAGSKSPIPLFQLLVDWNGPPRGALSLHRRHGKSSMNGTSVWACKGHSYRWEGMWYFAEHTARALGLETWNLTESTLRFPWPENCRREVFCRSEAKIALLKSATDVFEEQFKTTWDRPKVLVQICWEVCHHSCW